MTKKILKGYIAAIVLSFLFLLFIGIDFETLIYQEKEEQEVEVFTGLEITERTEDTIVLHGILPERELGNECLGFLTYHEEVKVYAAGGLAYSLNHAPNKFGSTTGQVWNFVNLRTRYANQPVTIKIIGIYGEPEVPTIYMGSKLSMYMMIIKNNIFSYSLCVLTLLLGIIMLIYWLYARSRTYIQANMLYLGIFSILLGIWSMNEVSINILVFHNHVLSSYLAFVSLMLLPIPFLLFVRSLYNENKGWGWNFAMLLSLANIVAGIFLQAFNIVDMKHSLVGTHIVLAATAIVMIVYTIKEIRRGKLNRNIKVNIFCIILDIVASGADIFNYYFMSRELDGNLFGRPAFLLHVILLGWVASKESTILMQKGREAAIYEKLAYHDQLTGVFNRTAFEEDMEKMDETREGVLVIMMDLNDLKKCNDTLGHDAGDRYIQNAAVIISQVFEKVGKCYRIGGDEFCTVFQTEDENAQQVFFEKLEKLEGEYNRNSTKEQMAIAYGYARYDGGQDQTLTDTRSRADAMMYANKKKMKAKRFEGV